MFARLFSESGLSLERLRTLLEVGASGSIVKAAGGDPVRQSQYSRQIKELEDFFQTALVERQGRNLRLTSGGRELARISRFFLLGLSNFQRGCLSGRQTFRLGASRSFISTWLVPFIAGAPARCGYVTETVGADEAERRLHDLTLDFAIVTRGSVSRPLQCTILGQWRLELWMSRQMRISASAAVRALERGELPLALAEAEFADLGVTNLLFPAVSFRCESFLEARASLGKGKMAALVPEFLMSEADRKAFVRLDVPELEGATCGYYLAWNPRLLRLNTHAIRQRDFLVKELAGAMRHNR